MTDDFLKELEGKIRKERQYFWLMILSAFLMLLLARLWQGFPSNLLEVFRDLRSALVVSFVIFAVEGRVRRLHLEQLQNNVLASVLKVAMPKELANEFLEIIKEKVFREELRYTFTFQRCDMPAQKGTKPEPSDYFILRRKLSYTLRNITATTQDTEVSSSSDWKYPFVVDTKDFGIEVDGHQVQLIISSSSPDGFPRAVFGLLKRLIRRDSSGSIDVKAEKVEMCHKIRMLGGSTRKVSIQACEIVRLDERNYTMVFLKPGADLEVTLINQHNAIASIKADLNHRAGAKFVPRHDIFFHFPGALLPGQSFEVSWIPVRQGLIPK